MAVTFLPFRDQFNQGWYGEARGYLKGQAMPTRLKGHKEHQDAGTRDPQCGKVVDPRKAISVTWEGKTYFFCSETCRKNFDADPPGDASF